jgi:hypothetical protein
VIVVTAGGFYRYACGKLVATAGPMCKFCSLGGTAFAKPPSFLPPFLSEPPHDVSEEELPMVGEIAVAGDCYICVISAAFRNLSAMEDSRVVCQCTGSDMLEGRVGT